jgi:hypothetical protein
MVQPPPIDALRLGFADTPVTAAPMMRWWWFGPSVDRDELTRELTAMAAAGFGGVEVASVLSRHHWCGTQRLERDRDHRQQHGGQRASGRPAHIIELAAQSEARYGRRFRMQHMDRAMASVRSGLLSVPMIVVSASTEMSASTEN